MPFSYVFRKRPKKKKYGKKYDFIIKKGKRRPRPIESLAYESFLDKRTLYLLRRRDHLFRDVLYIMYHCRRSVFVCLDVLYSIYIASVSVQRNAYMDMSKVIFFYVQRIYYRWSLYEFDIEMVTDRCQFVSLLSLKCLWVESVNSIDCAIFEVVTLIFVKKSRFNTLLIFLTFS